MDIRTYDDMSAVVLFSKLKEKEVVSIADGKRLGRIVDAEIDLAERRITAIILPHTNGRIAFFEKAEEWRIPWEMIERIGEDVILVKAVMMNEKKSRRGLRLFPKKES